MKDLVWLGGLVVCGLLGFYVRTLADRLRALEVFIKEVISRKADAPVEETPPSVFIDPDDVVSQIRREHEKKLRELNQ